MQLKKIKLRIELTYDDVLMHGDDPDSISWFFREIILGQDLYLLDGGELGDEVGKVKVMSIDKF